VHRPLQLLLLTLALGALAAPAPALADVPAGDWQITGLVLGGQKIAATGKLSLGSQVGASVGCNSIGGPFTIDGNTITVGSMQSTLVGCPADIGQAEDALTKILGAGPITIAADKWTSAAGEIDLVAASDGGGSSGGGVPECIPPVAPGANPGNVTVPCGNGGSSSGGGDIGVLSTVGTPVDGPPPPDPLTVASAIGVVVLIVATIVAFVYLGPRRNPGGSQE
jgi:heat shock protein HslJ